MKRMHFLRMAVAAMAGVLTLTACGAPAPAPPPAPSDGRGNQGGEYQCPKMNIIVAHASPTTDARHIGAEAMKAYIEEQSGGSITVDIYPNGQLGDVTSSIESTQNGTIQITILPPANIVSFNPLLGVLDVPYFLPGNLADARTIMDGPAGEALLDTMRDCDLVGLAWWDSQFKEFTANKPLRTTADFKGLKFRVMPSAILLKMIDSLGGSAVTFDYSEVFSGLQTGAIDGQEASLASIYNMKFHEVQKYVSLTNHIKSEILVFAGKSWYDGLEPEVRALVDEACRVGAEANNRQKTADEADSRRLIEEDGTQFAELTGEELQGLSDAARQPCLDLYLESNGAAGKGIVDAFNAEIEKLG